MKQPWRPLLSGEEAERAIAIAREIADAVGQGEGEPPSPLTPWQTEIWRNTLGTGEAGFCLLRTYLSLHTGRADDSDRAIEHLDRAADFIATIRSVPSLFHGLFGIGWVSTHLDGRLFEADSEEGDELDAALTRLVAEPPYRGDYDLLNGLAGFGLYALERLPRPAAADCLVAIVERLAERAHYDENGAAFFTPPEEVLQPYRTLLPEGVYNLGAAHGLPGVIGFLAGACSACVAGEAARSLLGACVSWLLKREMPPDCEYRFPHFYMPGLEPSPSRVGWCYGDLGIASTLLVAARGAGEPQWEAEAIRIARAAALRDPAETRIADAGVCHGAAGAAHLFNRLAQATGDGLLEATALDLYRRALAFHRPGRGVGGIEARFTGASGEEEWRADPGFLAGATGAGLALVAASSSVDPEWDRLFAASFRESRS